MLYYFFSNKEESKSLFKGLNIFNNEEAMKHLNQYPVISFSLKDLSRRNFNDSIEMLKDVVYTQVNHYKEILDSDKVSLSDRKILQKIFDKEANQTELLNSLLILSRSLEAYYGKKTIILIDEYDVPLQAAYQYGYYDEMVDFIRGMFSAALKTNSSLEKGILTGCLRIARESIFTGLNNLRVHSIFDDKTGSYFGFTQKEMDQILEYYSLLEYREEVKDWYDGYLFGKNEIYNPWSTLKYVSECLYSIIEPKSYFHGMPYGRANSSGNDIVKDYIEKSSSTLKEEFEILSKGGCIEKTIKPELTYREMDDIDNIYSFLLFTGYLKTVKEMGRNTYTLTIPNKEVSTIYNDFFND